MHACIRCLSSPWQVTHMGLYVMLLMLLLAMAPHWRQHASKHSCNSMIINAQLRTDPWFTYTPAEGVSLGMDYDAMTADPENVKIVASPQVGAAAISYSVCQQQHDDGKLDGWLTHSWQLPALHMCRTSRPYQQTIHADRTRRPCKQAILAGHTSRPYTHAIRAGHTRRPYTQAIHAGCTWAYSYVQLLPVLWYCCSHADGDPTQALCQAGSYQHR